MIDQCGCNPFDLHVYLTIHSFTDAARDLFEALHDPLPDPVIKCANRAFQFDLRRDHVERRPAMDIRNTDNSSIQRRHIPCDDRLQCIDDIRSCNDRIHSHVWDSAMPASASNVDRKDVCAGHDRTGLYAQPAQRLFIPQMEGEAHIHFRIVQQPVAHHRFGAACFFSVWALLGWLEAELDRAAQFLTVRMQDFSNCQPDRGVTVVPAGMHNSVILRGIFGAGLLGDGKSIHIEAQHQCGTGFCSFKQADHSGLANPFCHFNPKRLQFLCNNPAGSELAEPQLRMHVKVASKRLGVGEEVFGLREEVRHKKSFE